jgi:hypothetical protein
VASATYPPKDERQTGGTSIPIKNGTVGALEKRSEGRPSLLLASKQQRACGKLVNDAMQSIWSAESEQAAQPAMFPNAASIAHSLPILFGRRQWTPSCCLLWTVVNTVAVMSFATES